MMIYGDLKSFSLFGIKSSEAAALLDGKREELAVGSNQCGSFRTAALVLTGSAEVPPGHSLALFKDRSPSLMRSLPCREAGRGQYCLFVRACLCQQCNPENNLWVKTRGDIRRVMS